MKFNQVEFVTSALKLSELPTLKLDTGKFAPEIAIVGRSNVGKSSLINTLFQNKKVAKTSSTPGKTQRINFFKIDGIALFVDLPGYGFSKAPKEFVEEWSQAIDEYLNSRKTLKLILLLIDIRREPCKEDLMIAEWAVSKKVPFLTIFTKSDKLKRTDLPQIPGSAGMMTFTNVGFHDRAQLIKLINGVYQWD